MFILITLFPSVCYDFKFVFFNKSISTIFMEHTSAVIPDLV